MFSMLRLLCLVSISVACFASNIQCDLSWLKYARRDRVYQAMSIVSFTKPYPSEAEIYATTRDLGFDVIQIEHGNYAAYLCPHFSEEEMQKTYNRFIGKGTMVSLDKTKLTCGCEMSDDEFKLFIADPLYTIPWVKEVHQNWRGRTGPA